MLELNRGLLRRSRFYHWYEGGQSDESLEGTGARFCSPTIVANDWDQAENIGFQPNLRMNCRKRCFLPYLQVGAGYFCPTFIFVFYPTAPVDQKVADGWSSNLKFPSFFAMNCGCPSHSNQLVRTFNVASSYQFDRGRKNRSGSSRGVNPPGFWVKSTGAFCNRQKSYSPMRTCEKWSRWFPVVFRFLGWELYGLHWITNSLKPTAILPLKIGRIPKGNDRIPNIRFQVQAVSFREGIWSRNTIWL